MKPSHSFLKRMQFKKNDTLLTSLVSCTTYHPAGKKTVHAMRTGNESFLTKINFLSDLNWFLVHYSPDIIIVSDSSDRHGDHAALIELLQNTNAFHQIPICLTYIIHGGMMLYGLLAIRKSLHVLLFVIRRCGGNVSPSH